MHRSSSPVSCKTLDALSSCSFPESHPSAPPTTAPGGPATTTPTAADEAEEKIAFPSCSATSFVFLAVFSAAYTDAGITYSLATYVPAAAHIPLTNASTGLLIRCSRFEFQ